MFQVPTSPRMGVTGLYGAMIATMMESLLKSHGFGATVAPVSSMQVIVGLPRPGTRVFWTATTAAVSALDPGTQGVAPAHGCTDVTRAISRAAWDTPLYL